MAALRIKVPGIRWVLEGGGERCWNPFRLLRLKSAIKPLQSQVADGSGITGIVLLPKHN